MEAVRIKLYFLLFLKFLQKKNKFFVVLNFIQYKLSTMLRLSKLSHGPISAVFYVNKVCNFSCSFCYNKDVLNQKDSKDYDLTFEQFSIMMNSKMIKRSIRVAFLGGEPTLNKDLYRMIKYANEIGKITNFITNASRLHENDFIKIKQSGVDVVGISLYENNSDDVCRVVQGFNRLNIMFWVQVVISQSMIPKLRSYVEDLLASGCGSLILSKYNPYFDKKYSQVVEADDPSYIEFENWLKANVKNRMRIQFLNREKQKVKTIQKKCRLPFSYIHVDSKGDLGPCCFRYPKNEYGNIYNNQAWNGAKTIELRDNLLDSTKDPIGECVNCENLHRDLYGF